MPKMKTRRAAAKRFSRSGSGQFRHNRAFRSHLLGKKTTKRKRKLRGKKTVHPTDLGHVRGMVPYA